MHAHGQGRATALAFAKEGACVAAYDLAKQAEYPDYRFGTDQELVSLKEEIEASGSEALIFTGDVRNNDEVQYAVDKTIEEFGHIDILFNNAGICAYYKVDEMTDEAWDAMVGINLTGAFKVTRAVVPHMKNSTAESLSTILR